MFNWTTFTLLLALSHSAHFWTLGNVKDVRRRSLSSPLTGNLPDDTDPEEYLQDWLTEEIDLQRRADEELQAAEIASAEEEYERIKYDLELQRRSGLAPGQEVVKRADLALEGLAPGQAVVKRSDLGLEGLGTDEDFVKRSDGDEEEREKKEIEPEMGIPDKFCDDGKRLLENDWDPKDPANVADYTCNTTTLVPDQKSFQPVCMRPKKPRHHCMRTKLEKQSEPPVRGAHRPLWAKYGKYLYLPWQRWLHNLEHGAIGLLYHKCADPDQVKAIEHVLTSCIRKHIITPYELPADKPFALVSWGCYLYMTHFDKKVVFDFIKKHALHGRENTVRSDGQYSELLIKPAEYASDYEDSHICPKQRFPEMYELSSHREFDHETTKANDKGLSAAGLSRSQVNSHKALLRHKRDVDWIRSTNQNTASDKDSDLIPELEIEGEISKLENEEGLADVQREAKIAELEHEEDLARLERESDIAHLQRDLHAIKKLFHQKVKPLMHN